MAKAIRPTPTIGPAPFGSTGDIRKADNEGDYKGGSENDPTNHGIPPALLTGRERDRAALNRACAEPRLNPRSVVCSGLQTLVATK
jgi:hypothetical protein